MADTRFFEDIEPGEEMSCGSLVVTREDIVAFARVYDPQPFHLDEEAGRASLLGGLAASGWHTAAIAMRLYFDGFVRHVAGMGAPGIDEVRWLRPVRPGDRLSLTAVVEGKRASASRPDRGFVTMTLSMANAAGQAVLSQRFSMIVQRRGASRTPTATAAAGPVAGPTDAPAADPMLAAFYEDIPVGRETILGHQLFTPEAIVAFATAFDPQSFHVDAERAKASHFGGLIASGWQTAAYWMKAHVAARDRASSARAALGLPVACGGPSPGFRNLKWIHPVRAGETITYSQTVTNRRPTKRAGWGLFSTQNRGVRADGTLVFTFDGTVLWPMKPT